MLARVRGDGVRGVTYGADEIENLKARGVRFETNTVVGRTVLADELFADGYEAVFIGSGAGLPNFMKVKGEDLKGVYSANEFLTRVNLMKAYKPGAATPVKHSRSVAVVGGGNVAMDAARCALRLGAEKVTIVYRRSADELPARREEVEHAEEEGVEFMFLTAPVEVLGDEHKNAVALRCQRMELGEPDKDTTPGISVNSRGCIIVDERGMTARDMVYAGGDAVTGAATVILAMGAGKDAAARIDEAIRQKSAK